MAQTNLKEFKKNKSNLRVHSVPLNQVGYSTILNSFWISKLKDRTKIVLGLLLSQRNNPNFIVNAYSIADIFECDESTIRRSFHELKKFGYLNFERVGMNGIFPVYEYELYEDPKDNPEFNYSTGKRYDSKVQGKNADIIIKQANSLSENFALQDKLPEKNPLGIFSADKKLKLLTTELLSWKISTDNLNKSIQVHGWDKITFAYEEVLKREAKKGDVGNKASLFFGILNPKKKNQLVPVKEIIHQTEPLAPNPEDIKYRDIYRKFSGCIPDEKQEFKRKITSEMIDNDIKGMNETDYLFVCLAPTLERLKQACDIEKDLDLPYYSSIKDKLGNL